MPIMGKEAIQTKPSAITTCNFNQFTAVLTSQQLIIQSPHSTETFLLSGIESISLYNNYTAWHLQLQKFEKRRRQLYWFIGTPAIALCFLFIFTSWPLQCYGWVASPFLSLLISAFLPVPHTNIHIQSQLSITTNDDTRTYPFSYNNINTSAITHFIQRLTENRSALPALGSNRQC